MVSEQTRNTIIRLAGQGFPPRVIHEELKKSVSIGVIYKTLHEAKEAGTELPNFRIAPAAGGHKILSNKVIRALGPHARQRRVSVTDLARMLLGRIAADDLVQAVLDDRPPVKKAKAPKR